MMDTISKQEAARLLGISIREVERQIAAGELQASSSSARFHRGKAITEVLASSLPAAAQMAWAESRESAIVGPSPARPLSLTGVGQSHAGPFGAGEAERGSALQPARRDLLIGQELTEPQMVLDFDRKDAFRLLPRSLANWAWTWFERLTEAGLLCLIDNDSVLRNGGWRKKFLNRELRTADGRCFYIRNKEDVVEYIAATFQVSPAFIWERLREFQEFFTYIVGQKRARGAIDLSLVAQIFPARAKDSGGRFRPRADAGVSKTIPQTAAEFLLARYGAGSRPGTDGWRPSFALVHNEYETLRQAIIDAGENPDEHGYPEVSIYALRRLLPRALRESDPGLVLAREGSAALRDRVTPYIPRDKTNLFAHDWWVSDHRQSNLWVRWSKDPRVIYRPWTTWLMEVRTQYPLAFVLGPVPSSLTIFRALKIAFFTFETACRVFYCDNGKDYRAILIGSSQQFPMEASDKFDDRQTGLLGRFGIEHRLTLPSRRSKSSGETECHARSKPIEAWFGQWLNPFDDQQPGACGKDPDDKPDKVYVELAGKEKAADLNSSSALLLDVDYERRLAAYVSDRIINQASRGLKGLTPAEALQRYSRAAWGLEERHLVPEQIGELALVRDHRTVKNSMVTVKIGGEERKYEHSAFFSLSGQDIEIAYDPTEPNEMFVYYNGSALGRAAEVSKVPWGSSTQDSTLQIQEGMRKQRIAAKSARATLARRQQAAGWVPDQGAMTAIRELMIKKRILPGSTGSQPVSAQPGVAVPPVAHACSIERVRKSAAGSRQPAATQKRMTADDVAKAFLEEEDHSKGE